MLKKLLIAVLIGPVVTAALPALAAEPPALNPKIENADWIWLKGFEETPEVSIYFRKTFSLSSQPVEAVMQITCDNSYKVWINGEFAAQTMKPGPEAWRAADSYDVARLLKTGDNYIAVQGTNQSGKAAVIVQINVRTQDGSIVTLNTDSTWEAASETGGNWQQAATDSGNWQQALDYGPAATTAPWYYPRPPSPLEPLIAQAKPSLKSNVVNPVSVKLDASTNTNVTGIGPPGSSIPGDTLRKVSIEAAKPGQKAVFICDFGKEVVGHPMLMGQNFGGVKITVACGEYEGECDAPYQPVQTEQCKSGGIRWRAPERRAFRYAKLVIEPARLARIDRIQADLSEYTVDEEAARFECSDEMLNKIWDVSRRTLHVCMQDYYEDGVKRDKLLWVGDLRVEALVGYYVFGDTGLARRGLMQMAALQLPDGIIPGVGPTSSTTYLPDYCAYYVIALADYYRWSGDNKTVELLYPNVQKLMDWFQANCDESGMFRRADRQGWWIFVDWDASMEKKDRVMAMEALYYWALKDAAELALAADFNGDHHTYLQRADELRAAIDSTLWSEQQGAYVDCAADGGPSSLVHKQPNALAMLAGVPDAEKAAAAAQALADDAKTPLVTTPYMNFYVASALFEHGNPAGALELMRSYWGGMIQRQATTFWERFDPAWPTPYQQADLSYCHGWSSGPGAMLPAYVAGVRPASAGFKRVIIAPELAGLEWVKATVPVPLGRIKVDWKAENGCAVGTIDLPRDCGATVMLQPPPENFEYQVNGRRVRCRQENGKISFTLKGGDVYTVGLQQVPAKQ